MTRIAVYATDLLTGRQHCRLPVSSATFTEILSAPGSFEIVIPVDAPQARRVSPDYIRKGDSGVWIERNGVLLFGGIVWTTGFDGEANTVTVRGEGFHSYARHRFIDTTLIFNSVDQLSVASQILGWMSAKTNGDAGIRVPATLPVTVNRTQTYNGFELKAVADAIEGLASMADGFDFRYLPFVDPADGIRRVMFTPVTPLAGRPTSYVFTLKGNCSALTSEADGTEIARTAYAVGGGEGDTMPIGVASNPKAASRLLLESVDAYSDVTDLAALQSKARLSVTQNLDAVELPTLRIDPDANPPLGSYGPGDLVAVRGQYGLMQVNGQYKITQQTYTANETGESVDVVVAAAGVFAS